MSNREQQRSFRRATMKKLGAFLLGVGLMAGSAFAADSNTATSVNIVGFQNITCPRGQLVMVSTAFKSLDGSTLKSENVFSNQLPMGSFIYAWNSVSNRYDIDNLDLDGWKTNITYDGKMGFWIRVSPSAPTSSYNVVMSGEVPMSAFATNTVCPGLNMLGYPYTASVAWTNTSLAINSKPGDFLFVWNGSGYSTYNNTLDGWEAATNLVINQGVGFWFKSSRTSITNYVDARPY
jgi:hypothetical protein